MKSDFTENTAVMQRGRPFRKGESGNPSGKPIGTRHKATIAAQALLDGEAENITRRAVELAMAGDTTAMRLVLERIVPPRRESPVKFTLPELKSIHDLPDAMQSIVQAVVSGEVLPSEAHTITSLLESWRKAVETAEFEERITNLENNLKK